VLDPFNEFYDVNRITFKCFTSGIAGKLRFGYPESITPEEIPF